MIRTWTEAWNAIVGPRLRKSDIGWTEQDSADRHERIHGPLDPADREARRETPAFDVAAFYAECREAERLRDIEAETDAGCARAKQLRLKRAAAAFKGIANAKVRGV